MSVFRVLALTGGLISGFLLNVAAMAATAPAFNKDVLPILQNNCQECHRLGRDCPDVAPELHRGAAVG